MAPPRNEPAAAGGARGALSAEAMAGSGPVSAAPLPDTMSPVREQAKLESGASQRAHDLQGSDDSYVNQPLPISDSVLQFCQKTDRCESVFIVLRELAQEPRDLTWAPRTEDILRRFVQSYPEGRYSIRAIECRTSGCVMEVSSPVGSLPLMYGHPLFDDSMLERINRLGFEYDDSGKRTVVDFRILVKRH